MFKVGLSHPTGPFPKARRPALMLEMKAPATGQEAEVPATPPRKPLGKSALINQMKKFAPHSEISGYPLPPALYPGSAALPSAIAVLKYVATASSCQGCLA
jgi:hypothetical protein